MAKKDYYTRPLRIPASLVAFVHDTSDGAVRTSKSLNNNAGQRYQATEEEIREAILGIKEKTLEESKA
jgi:hypothetical protein